MAQELLEGFQAFYYLNTVFEDSMISVAVILMTGKLPN